MILVYRLVPPCLCPILSEYFHQVGQSWTPPNDQCVTFNCTKVNDIFVLVKIPPSCPEYNPKECIPVCLSPVANLALTSYTDAYLCLIEYIFQNFTIKE